MALTDGLIAWYDFEDDVLDAHQGHDLTYGGSFETGLVGQALTAGSDKCYYPQDGSFSQGDSDFTFAFWWKPADLSVKTYLTAKGGEGNTSREFDFQYSATADDRRFEYGYPADSSGLYPKAPTAGTWHLVVVRYGASADELRVDVRPVGGTNGSDTASFAGGMSGDSGDADLTIGGRTNTYHSGNFEDSDNGPIDSYAFWSRRLTNAERDELYNSGNGVSYADISESTIPPSRHALLMGM